MLFFFSSLFCVATWSEPIHHAHKKKHTHSYGHNKITNNKCLGPWLICSLVAWFIFFFFYKSMHDLSPLFFLSFFLCHFHFFLCSYFEVTRSISSIENSSNFRSQFNFLVATEEEEEKRWQKFAGFPNLHTLTEERKKHRSREL